MNNVTDGRNAANLFRNVINHLTFDLVIYMLLGSVVIHLIVIEYQVLILKVIYEIKTNETLVY